MQDDPHFLKVLGLPDLKKEYVTRKKRAIRDARKRFGAEKGSIQDNLEEGIREDQRHTEILNACIFPFLANGELAKRLRYRFLLADPLYEKGERNLDFVLLRDSDEAVSIFGDAKGTIKDPDYAIADVRDKVRTAERFADIMRKEYFGGLAARREYVIGVDSVDSNETSKAIARKGGNLIVWHADRSDESTLNLLVPAAEKPLRESMMHKDDELNRALKKVKTATSVFTFFRQSHTYSKMLLLTLIKKQEKGELVFTRESLLGLVKDTIPYANDETWADETEGILTTGVKIGFLRKENGRIRIVSRHRSPDGLQSDLRKRWVIYRLGQRWEEIEKEETEKVQQEMIRMKANIPTLDKAY